MTSDLSADEAGWEAVDEPIQPMPSAGPPWRGLAVGLAIAIAVVLLVVAVTFATRDGGGAPPAPTPTTTGRAADGGGPASTAGGVSGGVNPPLGDGPVTTRQPTPLAIVASDDRRVVVLDQSGAAAPRVLFDLGASTSSDQVPPVIGGVALSADAKTVYFDIVGNPAAGSLNQTPVAGGPIRQLGPGVVPIPSPDGTMLASISALEPDVPATLVVRTLAGANEKRIDLGDGTCGNVAWSPVRQEIAVDICTGGEPVTVALVDIATAGVRQLAPPNGTTWSTPAYKPDGTLTVVEQRNTDAAVVTLTADTTKVATTILRRPSTSITTLDWSAAGDLLVCDVDGIVLVLIGGGKPQQVATGYTAAVW